MSDQPQSVPLLDLKLQYGAIRSEVEAALRRVCDSQQFILGPEVEAFEGAVAAYCECEFAIGVSSGTDALLVALMALDVAPGDEVITAPYSFFATASTIARLGAHPVFVDIDPKTFNINPNLIEEKITPKTKAVMPVHLFGQCAEMEALLVATSKHDLPVIEDAAQALGAEYYGRRAGSMGDIGCFSFFPSKNLGGFGDAGMVTTDDPVLAERIRVLRVHGSKQKYEHLFLGGNFRLDALQAAVLGVKLPHLDGWTARRQHNARRYRQLLEERKLVGLPSSPLEAPSEMEACRHIFNQFVVRTHLRDRLLDFLKTKRIGVEVYYPKPLHLQPCFSALGYREGDFPESERAAKETLALPIFPELSDEQLRYVADSLAEFFRR